MVNNGQNLVNVVCERPLMPFEEKTIKILLRFIIIIVTNPLAERAIGKSKLNFGEKRLIFGNGYRLIIMRSS